MQPPHGQTLEKLIFELEDAIDRDQQFITRGGELLDRWKAVAQLMEERLRNVLDLKDGTTQAVPEPVLERKSDSLEVLSRPR
jgi:hypothetical protein